MTKASIEEQRSDNIWISSNSGEFKVFKEQVSQQTELQNWPFAKEVLQNVLVYEGDTLRSLSGDPTTKRHMMAELVVALSSGPGVLIVKQAMPDLRVIDQATLVFEEIIQKEKETNQGSGDHFAKAGSNDRIWNALEKHCLADPKNFMNYYGNIVLAMVSEAWLGVGYQMTAQVNRVNPGEAAQLAHRDYHLGFMSVEQMARYPSHIHQLSPLLTLQGAVAHCDIPLSSGPTMLLPYSQKFFEGYLAFGREEFQNYFQENHVQLPLEKGDAVFFNPALMHAAGSNKSADIYRMANLLQISSAFGRAMESVDRTAMVSALYPVLLSAQTSGILCLEELNCAIAAAAEGYPFPTNLDLDSPTNGLAPKTQAQKLYDALLAKTDPDLFQRSLKMN